METTVMNAKLLASLTALALAASMSAHAAGGATTNSDWWPEKLDLQPLRQHAAASNPMGKDFNYAESSKSSISRP
jgi:catalase-peroxidase